MHIAIPLALSVRVALLIGLHHRGGHRPGQAGTGAAQHLFKAGSLLRGIGLWVSLSLGSLGVVGRGAEAPGALLLAGGPQAGAAVLVIGAFALRRGGARARVGMGVGGG